MAFSTFGEAVEEVQQEWNRAEHAIKLAEQINGEVINPSIYELRYAGRRIIEALACQDSDPDRARRLMADAHFDCCRARHDAIDAATSKVSMDMDAAVSKLGARNILKYFPKYTLLIRHIVEARKMIAESRKDRDRRDAIYEAVEKTAFLEIVDLYREFVANENTIKSAAQQDRFERLGSRALGVIAILVAAGAWYFS